MNEISKYQSFEIMKREVENREKKALFIGIDVAKDQHVACMGDNFGYCDDKVFSFSNDSKGYEELLKRVGLKISDHDYVIFGVEATGGYEKALSEYLHNKSYGVVRVPTVSVKRERELATGSWHKSDKRDTQAITRIMQRGVFQYYRFRDEHWENIDNLN